MIYNTLRAFFLLTLLLSGHDLFAQSLQTLQAQMRSMEACRQSLKHANCNLKILDKDIRDALIQLDQINQQRQVRSEPPVGQLPSQGDVQFFTATILEVNNEVMKMMDGSVWRLDRGYFGLPLQDIIGVMSDQRNAVIHANDNFYNARLLTGMVSTFTGNLRTVTEKMGEGSILRLDNGMLLEFSSYDKYDTGWWLPPYKVMIDFARMNLWNLGSGKKVWIQRILR